MDGDLGPRSIFLKGFVFLANAFLVVALLSGVFGVVDDLLLKAPMDGSLFGLRMQLASLTMVLTLIALLLVILVPQLPRLALFIPVAVGVWQMLGAPGYKWSVMDRASWIGIDAAAVAATLLAFLIIRMRTGGWFIRAADLPFKGNLVLRSLIAAPFAALIALFVMVGSLIAAIPIYIEKEARGYLHFAAEGLDVRETVLRKGDSTVYLIGMVHIGDPEFYRKLYASFPVEALILAEGVSDRGNVMKSAPSYEKAAEGMGLQSQGIFQQLLRESRNPDEVIPPGAAPAPATRPYVVFADADVSDLTPATVQFLEKVGTIFQSPTLEEAINRYAKLAQTMDEKVVEAAMKEILVKRNARLMENFDRYAPRFQQIYMPWGALHMPELEDALLKRGYRIESSRTMQIAKYQTIIEGLQKSLAPKAPAAAPEAPATAPTTAPTAPAAPEKPAAAPAPL